MLASSAAVSQSTNFLGVLCTVVGFEGKKRDQDCPRFPSLYIFPSSSSSFSSSFFFHSFFTLDQLIPFKECNINFWPLKPYKQHCKKWTGNENPNWYRFEQLKGCTIGKRLQQFDAVTLECPDHFLCGMITSGGASCSPQWGHWTEWLSLPSLLLLLRQGLKSTNVQSGSKETFLPTLTSAGSWAHNLLWSD